MASLLTNAPRWIESALVHASSDEVFRNSDGPDGGTKTNDGDDGSDAHLLDSQYDAEPQTENTIPSGLLPSPEKDDDDVGGGEAPSRRGRIAQVIRRGGDVAYYDPHDQQNQNNDGARGGRRKGKNKRKRIKRRAPCPPYLILHDGRHSTLAFLSPETLAASEGQLPPNKCLVSINQFAVSTIRLCAESGVAHTRIMSELYRDAALIPDDIQEQLRHQVPDTLFLCLYLQRPIHVLGAENQGLIGHPVDVHCSVPLRRALMQHRKEWSGGNDANSNEAGQNNDACGTNGDIVYEKLLEKLEASHILCQLAAKERTAARRARGEQVPHAQGSPRRGKKQYGRRHKNHTQQQEGGHDEAEDEDLVPDWPWESRLIDEHPENVDVQAVKVEEEDAQFNPMGEVLESNPGGTSPGNVDDGREMAEEGRRDGSGSDADAQTGDCAPEGGANDAPPAAPGNVEELLDNFDGSEFPSQNSEETEKNAGAPAGRSDEANKVGEGSSIAMPIERGNVEELFDNFDDIEDILDEVASEAPSHRQDATLDGASDALDGGASGPSEEERNERDSAADGDGGEPPANEKASNAKSPSPNKVRRSPRKGATADEVWDWMSAEGTAEEGGTQSEAGGDQGASFVGIDDMMVDEEDEEEDDDDNNAGEAREEGGDADDEPLFTQPDDYREDDDDYDEEGFDPKSQIPLKTRKAPPDAAGYPDNEGQDAGVQSQIPLSMRKAPPETLGQMAMGGENAEEDSRPESQSPKMRTKKSKQSGRGAKRGKSQPTERTDERGDYVESQLPLERKRPARAAISRQEHGDSDDSSDDWMRVSRSRPQHDAAEDESSIDDPSESQMAAGEGSEESVPPSQSLKSQEPRRKLRSSPSGRRRGQPEEGDEAQPSRKRQASARGDSHHVRFSIGPEDGQARRSKRSKPASDTSKGDLRGEVPPNTDGSTHTKKKARKNLKTSKEFDMGQFLKRAKRFI